MKDWYKYVIGLLVGVGVVLLIFLYLVPEPVIDDTNYIELKNRYDSLTIEVERMYIYQDSLLQLHQKELELKLKEQTKIVSYYERRIKDLSDVTIVSNDSITKYISSRIYNR